MRMPVDKISSQLEELLERDKEIVRTENPTQWNFGSILESICIIGFFAAVISLVAFIYLQHSHDYHDDIWVGVTVTHHLQRSDRDGSLHLVGLTNNKKSVSVRVSPETFVNAKVGDVMSFKVRNSTVNPSINTENKLEFYATGALVSGVSIIVALLIMAFVGIKDE